MKTLRRGVGWRDMSTPRRVAVVNEALARHHFPAENPLGHHLCFSERYDPAYAYEIIGVVENAKFDRMRGEPLRTAYVPYRAVADMVGLKTQNDLIDEALTQERMFARISSFFGLLALLLVSVGVYGTFAYAVTRRTGEIDIRMALGAGRPRVLWMILRESLALVSLGLAIGLPAAFALTRLVTRLIFGVKTYDVVTIVATIAILAAVAGVAGFLPANRASRIDPMRALRYE